MKASKSEKERNFSRIDPSGTDPNRYASVNKPADIITKSLIPGMPVNVSTVERIAMIAAGGYLLYRGLTGKKKHYAQGIAGGAMLIRGISGYCPMYAAMENNEQPGAKKVQVSTRVIINKPAIEVYQSWRDLKNLPNVINHISEVRELNKIESEWTAKGPLGIGSMTWKAHILADEPGKILSWQSVPDASVYNSGKITFTEIDENATELHATITYKAPLGKAGMKAAEWLTPLFEKELKNDLERFRETIENQPQIAQ